jgi:DNA-directed RNA polymerase specialized sigma24 family protein
MRLYNKMPGTTRAERTSASALIKTTAARGAPSPAAIEAERLVRQEGKGYSDVAAMLGVSARTVERYVAVVRQERRGR